MGSCCSAATESRRDIDNFRHRFKLSLFRNFQSSMGRQKKDTNYKNMRLPLFLNGKIKKDNSSAQCLDKKKVLKQCIKKLRRIDDPDTKLHRAVLLNNTLQRI